MITSKFIFVTLETSVVSTSTPGQCVVWKLQLRFWSNYLGSKLFTWGWVVPAVMFLLVLFNLKVSEYKGVLFKTWVNGNEYFFISDDVTFDKTKSIYQALGLIQRIIGRKQLINYNHSFHTSWAKSSYTGYTRATVQVFIILLTTIQNSYALLIREVALLWSYFSQQNNVIPIG